MCFNKFRGIYIHVVHSNLIYINNYTEKIANYLKICLIFIKLSCYNQSCVKKIWPLGQAVKTPPFHGGNTGSNPVGVTIFQLHIYTWSRGVAVNMPACHAGDRGFDSRRDRHYNYGSVAQLVEQWIEAPCVGSSTLS